MGGATGMSIQAVAWVLTSSESKGVTRLVAISLANHANDEAMCWPAQRTIAAEAGIGVGTVSLAIKRLVAMGELRVVENGGPARSARYVLVHLSNAARGPGVSAARGPGVDRTINNRQEPYVHLPNNIARAHRDCEWCGGSNWREVEKGVVKPCAHK